MALQGLIIICDLSIYTMNQPDFIVCHLMENSICLKRVKPFPRLEQMTLCVLLNYFQGEERVVKIQSDISCKLFVVDSLEISNRICNNEISLVLFNSLVHVCPKIRMWN